MQVVELENVHMALTLLMNSEPKIIFKIASELEQFNKERKDSGNLLSAVLNLTLEKNKDPVLILDGENMA